MSLPRDDPTMPEVDALTRHLLDHVGVTIRSARNARRWSQRRLAQASGCHQSLITRIERGAMPDLPLRTAIRVLTSLGIEPELRLAAPRVEGPPMRDRAHARCIGAAARRLSRAGFEVATEVEVGSGRWRGFVDLVAFHPVHRLLLVCEVKTELRDMGEVDRQLGSYVDAAWPAARARGWRPRAATGLLLLLWTAESDRRVQEQRTYLDRAFVLRWRTLAGLSLGAISTIPDRGDRGLAMLDPASRRRTWMIPTVIDGRRTPAPYADRLDFLAGKRTTRPAT